MSAAGGSAKTMVASVVIVIALAATLALGVFGASGETSCGDLGSTPVDSAETLVLAVDTVGSTQAQAGELAALVERELTEAVGSRDLAVTLIVDDGRAETPLTRPGCFAGTSFFLERRNPVREQRDRAEAVVTLARTLQDVISESTTESATEGSTLGLLQAAADAEAHRTVLITPARWAGGDCLNLIGVTADPETADAILAGCEQAAQLPDFAGARLEFRGLDRGAHAPEVVAWLSNQVLPRLCDGPLSAECEVS